VGLENGWMGQLLRPLSLQSWIVVTATWVLAFYFSPSAAGSEVSSQNPN